MNEITATIKYLPILYQICQKEGLAKALTFDLGVTLYSLYRRIDNLDDYLDDRKTFKEKYRYVKEYGKTAYGEERWKTYEQLCKQRRRAYKEQVREKAKARKNERLESLLWFHEEFGIRGAETIIKFFEY